MVSNVANFIQEEFKAALTDATSTKVKLYSPWVIPTSQWSLQWTPLAMDFHGDVGRQSSNWQFSVVLMAPETDIVKFSEEIDPTVDGSIMRVLADIKSFRWGSWSFSREIVGDTGGIQLIAICHAQLLGVSNDE